MPEISRFFGIIIAIFYNDHNPPHFHARYGDDGAVIRIMDFAVLEGYLPTEGFGTCHRVGRDSQRGALKDWQLATENKPLLAIEPLK